MSALLPEADIAVTLRNVSFGPKGGTTSKRSSYPFRDYVAMLS